ncbi:zinc uptake transcriptional repressor Zur [Pseudomonas aeruginosa]
MYKIAPKTPLACQPHDHSQCVSTALAEADALCARQGVRLTELRRRVLELVWQSHKPLGPTISSRCSAKPTAAAPPTVYRALDFLQENGLVHRIASLNAFVGCNNPEHSHQGQFLICRTCHTAIELEQPDISRAIVAGANSVGFAVESQTVEVVGLCGTCRDQKDA